VNFYGWSWQGRRSLAEFFFNQPGGWRPFHGYDDVVFCPLLVNDLVEILLRMLDLRLTGLYHVVSRRNSQSKYAFGRCWRASLVLIEQALFRRPHTRPAVCALPRSPLLTLRSDRLAHALGEALPGQEAGMARFTGCFICRAIRKRYALVFVEGAINSVYFFWMRCSMDIRIGSHVIGENHPTYFIADIAANHDGSLERAKLLIRLAKEAGADAAKFQNFSAPKIVSDYGFRSLGGQQSHQASGSKPVFEVYQSASIPFEWTEELKACCDEVGIDYFSSPYDFDAIDMLEPYMPAYKIGSGEITWPEALERMARKGKPVILATGASDIGEVQRAVHAILARSTRSWC
jgi:hypothetical protein